MPIKPTVIHTVLKNILTMVRGKPTNINTVVVDAVGSAFYGYYGVNISKAMLPEHKESTNNYIVKPAFLTFYTVLISMTGFIPPPDPFEEYVENAIVSVIGDNIPDIPNILPN